MRLSLESNRQNASKIRRPFTAGLSPRFAATGLLPVSLWAAYQLHGRVTFGGSDHDRATGVRFLVVSLTGYALNLALLTALVDGAGVTRQIAQLPSNGLIGLIALVMFQLMRRAVFPNPTPGAGRPAG